MVPHLQISRPSLALIQYKLIIKHSGIVSFCVYFNLNSLSSFRELYSWHILISWQFKFKPEMMNFNKTRHRVNLTADTNIMIICQLSAFKPFKFRYLLSQNMISSSSGSQNSLRRIALPHKTFMMNVQLIQWDRGREKCLGSPSFKLGWFSDEFNKFSSRINILWTFCN